MSTDLTGLIPHGWCGGEAVTKWWRGKHLHLYRLRKNCAQCQREMVLDVTRAAIIGEAKNAGLHLSRCPKCRAASKSEGATSRPYTKEDEPVAQVQSTPADNTELEQLRTWKATVTEELAGYDHLRREYNTLFNEVQPLKAEIHELKLRLAKFELSGTMAEKAALPSLKPQLGFRQPVACEPVQNTMGSKLTFPWQSD